VVWKVIFTPDISPMHRTLAAIGLPVHSLIADPAMALWAIAVADTWEWFPFTMLMVLAALQMIPGEPIVAPRIDGAGRLALFRYILFPYIRRCRRVHDISLTVKVRIWRSFTDQRRRKE